MQSNQSCENCRAQAFSPDVPMPPVSIPCCSSSLCYSCIKTGVSSADYSRTTACPMNCGRALTVETLVGFLKKWMEYQASPLDESQGMQFSCSPQTKLEITKLLQSIESLVPIFHGRLQSKQNQPRKRSRLQSAQTGQVVQDVPSEPQTPEEALLTNKKAVGFNRCSQTGDVVAFCFECNRIHCRQCAGCSFQIAENSEDLNIGSIELCRWAIFQEQIRNIEGSYKGEIEKYIAERTAHDNQSASIACKSEVEQLCVDGEQQCGAIIAQLEQQVKHAEALPSMIEENTRKFKKVQEAIKNTKEASFCKDDISQKLIQQEFQNIAGSLKLQFEAMEVASHVPEKVHQHLLSGTKPPHERVLRAREKFAKNRITFLRQMANMEQLMGCSQAYALSQKDVPQVLSRPLLEGKKAHIPAESNFVLVEGARSEGKAILVNVGNPDQYQAIGHSAAQVMDPFAILQRPSIVVDFIVRKRAALHLKDSTDLMSRRIKHELGEVPSLWTRRFILAKNFLFVIDEFKPEKVFIGRFEIEGDVADLRQYSRLRANDQPDPRVEWKAIFEVWNGSFTFDGSQIISSAGGHYEGGIPIYKVYGLILIPVNRVPQIWQPAGSLSKPMLLPLVASSYLLTGDTRLVVMERLEPTSKELTIDILTFHPVWDQFAVDHIEEAEARSTLFIDAGRIRDLNPNLEGQMKLALQRTEASEMTLLLSCTMSTLGQEITRFAEIDLRKVDDLAAPVAKGWEISAFRIIDKEIRELQDSESITLAGSRALVKWDRSELGGPFASMAEEKIHGFKMGDIFHPSDLSSWRIVLKKSRFLKAGQPYDILDVHLDEHVLSAPWLSNANSKQISFLRNQHIPIFQR